MDPAFEDTTGLGQYVADGDEEIGILVSDRIGPFVAPEDTTGSSGVRSHGGVT